MSTLPRKTIGLLISSGSAPLAQNHIKGAHQYTQERDLNLLTVICGPLEAPNTAHHRNKLLHLVSSRNIDGLIIPTSSIARFTTAERLKKLLQSYQDIPIVTIGSQEKPHPFINPDYYQGMADVIEHMITCHNCRKIVLIRGNQGHKSSVERERAYRDTLNKHNITVNEDYIYYCNLRDVEGESAVYELLDRIKISMDAIVTVNDSVATGVLAGLARRGIRVPEDIVVSGFQNKEGSENCDPPLTTVDEMMFEQGYQAAAALYLLIQGKKAREEYHIKTDLIIRNSCCRDYPYIYFDNREKVPSQSTVAEITKQIRKLKQTQANNDFSVRLLFFIGQTFNQSDNITTVIHEAIKILTESLQLEKTFVCVIRDDNFMKTELLAEYPSPAQIRKTPIEFDCLQGLHPQPQTIFQTDKRWSKILIPLYSPEKFLGYFVTDMFKFNLQIIENIIDRFSNAISRDMLAFFDPLTTLPNRRLFDDLLKIKISEAKRHEEQIALLFIDLDNFKWINDTLGHDAGDELLVTVSHRLKDSIRGEDVIARFGGDEFVIVLIRISHDSIKMIAERILGCLESKCTIKNTEFLPTGSIGIAIFPADAGDKEALLIKADTAMYQAKLTKNNYCFYNEKLEEEYTSRIKIGRKLEKALELKKLTVYFQPIISVETHKIISFEALIRWFDEEDGFIPPSLLIPIAEKTNMISKITEYVMNLATKQINEWVKVEPELRVSINLSSSEFKNRNLAEDIHRIIKNNNTDTRHIELEITESTILENQTALSILNKLQDFKINLCLDDFGTGMSSLKTLKDYPFETVKVDRSFISDLATNSDSRTIVRTVINMCHDMHKTVVGEGVETAEQLKILTDYKCDFVQGFLFAKPVPAEKITNYSRFGGGKDM